MSTSRFLSHGDILGFLFKDGEAYFRITGVSPTSLEAGNTVSNYGYIADVNPGTPSNWYSVVNPSNRREIVPETRDWAFHFAFGIAPSIAEIYIQYPRGIDRRYLYRSLSIGTVPAGAIRGKDHPYDGFDLCADNEIFTLHNEFEPSFAAHIPTTLAPASASIPVKLRFIGRKYKLAYLRQAAGLDTAGMSATERNRALANVMSRSDAQRAYFREIGDGYNPVDAPDWIAAQMRG